MSQNSTRIYWTETEVDEKLKSIMIEIYKTCKETAKEMKHEGFYTAKKYFKQFKNF